MVALRGKRFPVLDDACGEQMIAAVEAARKDGDSLGGIVECLAVGFPAGIGDPMFDGIEPRMASLLYGIPAVKGVEFGAGFAVAEHTGSQNNDAPQFVGAGAARSIRLRTNHGGGIDGGISNGMPIVADGLSRFSIGRSQPTVNLRPWRMTPSELGAPRSLHCPRACRWWKPRWHWPCWISFYGMNRFNNRT